MVSIDCDKLSGRMRDICRGHDDQGNPITMPAEQRQEYLRMWQRRERRLPKEAPVPCLAGTQLKRILKRFGLVPKGDCLCGEHAREMDNRGCDWCAENVETLAGRLVKEAARRNLACPQPLARSLVKIAIWQARRIQRRTERESQP